jgi:hypothetical protein
MKKIATCALVIAVLAGCSGKPPVREREAAAPEKEGSGRLEVATPGKEACGRSEEASGEGRPVPPPAPATRDGGFALAASAQRRRSPGFKLPGTWLAIESRGPDEVLEAALKMAEAVKPEYRALAHVVLVGALGLPLEGPLGIGSDRPATLLLLNPKKQASKFAAILGDGGETGLDLLAATLARPLGAVPRREGDLVVLKGRDDCIYLRRVAPWIVVAGDMGVGGQATDVLRRGTAPLPPDRGAHVSVSLDMTEIRDAFGEEIDKELGEMRGTLTVFQRHEQEPEPGQQGLPAIGPATSRIFHEHINSFEGLFNAIDGMTILLRFSPEACEITTSLRPAPDKALAPLAEKQKGAEWAVARALPPNGMISMAWRLDPAAAEGLVEELAKAVARVASGPEPAAKEIDRYRKLARNAISIGEMASTATAREWRLEAVHAFGSDLKTVGRIHRDITEATLEALSPMFKELEMGITYDYVPGARLREGKPVDRLTTAYKGEPFVEQRAMMQVLWGGPETVMELTEAPSGTVAAMGEDPERLLGEALEQANASGNFKGMGWPGASDELRRALARAPERTWLAGEVRMGAYVALTFGAMRNCQPLIAAMLPAAAELGKPENDPPLVSWVASEEGEITSYSRVPTVAAASLLCYFEKVKAAIEKDQREIPIEEGPIEEGGDIF